MKTKKYNYFYKITNLINNHYYYGIHSTNDINDGYMGSGSRLRIAYKKYGIENFKKEILKFFNTRVDAALYESEIVTESLIKDNECYNIILGGEKNTTLGTATVKNKNGEIFQIPVDDERIKNGELVGVTKGIITVQDSNGQHYRVSTDDERFLNGELKSLIKNQVRVFDNNGKCFFVSTNDERLKNGELIPWNKNLILAKNKLGQCFMVNKNDERFLTKEITAFWKNRKHNVETIEKIKKSHQLNGHQKGEKNSQYGSCWITKNKINKKIKKDDLPEFESLGWVKGRFIKK